MAGPKDLLVVKKQYIETIRRSPKKAGLFGYLEVHESLHVGEKGDL